MISCIFFLKGPNFALKEKYIGNPTFLNVGYIKNRQKSILGTTTFEPFQLGSIWSTEYPGTSWKPFLRKKEGGAPFRNGFLQKRGPFCPELFFSAHMSEKKTYGRKWRKTRYENYLFRVIFVVRRSRTFYPVKLLVWTLNYVHKKGVSHKNQCWGFLLLLNTEKAIFP